MHFKDHVERGSLTVKIVPNDLNFAKVHLTAFKEGLRYKLEVTVNEYDLKLSRCVSCHRRAWPGESRGQKLWIFQNEDAPPYLWLAFPRLLQSSILIVSQFSYPVPDSVSHDISFRHSLKSNWLKECRDIRDDKHGSRSNAL